MLTKSTHLLQRRQKQTNHVLLDAPGIQSLI
jgi:hypothetical protein